MKSLVDVIGTLTKGGLVVKTEVGEDIWIYQDGVM